MSGCGIGELVEPTVCKDVVSHDTTNSIKCRSSFSIETNACEMTRFDSNGMRSTYKDDPTKKLSA